MTNSQNKTAQFIFTTHDDFVYYEKEYDELIDFLKKTFNDEHYNYTDNRMNDILILNMKGEVNIKKLCKKYEREFVDNISLYRIPLN